MRSDSDTDTADTRFLNICIVIVRKQYRFFFFFFLIENNPIYQPIYFFFQTHKHKHFYLNFTKIVVFLNPHPVWRCSDQLGVGLVDFQICVLPKRDLQDTLLWINYATLTLKHRQACFAIPYFTLYIFNYHRYKYKHQWITIYLISGNIGLWNPLV